MTGLSKGTFSSPKVLDRTLLSTVSDSITGDSNQLNQRIPDGDAVLGMGAPVVTLPEGAAETPKWLEYVYRTAHPALRWLPTKLAEWIGENLQDEMGFPDKADKKAPPGTGCTPAELNHILQAHFVDGSLTTFGCVEWESQLFRGVMRARCYPFGMPKRRFHGTTVKVCCSNFHLSHVYNDIYHVIVQLYYDIP
jgi:hypothetical protein